MRIAKALRVEAGKTLAEVAAGSGVHNTALSKFENGRQGMTYANLRNLARYYTAVLGRPIATDDLVEAEGAACA